MNEQIEETYDIKAVDEWHSPKDDDLRPLIAMPNIPRPLHGVNPRTLLGVSTWNHMRRFCYAKANDTCEICGRKPDKLRNRHGHEVYEIDYVNGVAKFTKVFCLCSLCHLACIHTGRAITLWKQHNVLYPTEFLLNGAEHAFKIINEYNKDNPEADLRAYATFLEYLKFDELRAPMQKLIEKYDMKFYKETKNAAKWGDWKLIVGNREYYTPYKNEKEWKKAMEERSGTDTARMVNKNFDNEIYREIDKIINTESENNQGE